jgi:replicative DNA helicase
LTDEAPLLPRNLEAERSVLGAILLSEGAFNLAVAVVKPDDFFRDAHRRIFAAMITLAGRNDVIDLLTLKDELARGGVLEEVGGPAYVSALVDGVPRSMNVDHYAHIVKDDATRRAIIRAANTVAETARHSADPIEGIIAGAQQAMLNVATGRISGEFSTMRELAIDGMERIEAAVNQKGRLPGLPTGLKSLDDLTAGLQPTDLIIVGGRPGSGKTSLALNIAEHNGLKGRHVAIFELEMSKDQLFMRMLAGLARVDSVRIKYGNISGHEYARLSAAFGQLSEAPIFVDDTASISLIEIGAKCRRLAAEHGLDLVIVDYIGLMQGPPQAGKRYENRQLEVSGISRGLKVLAKDLRVPVVALAQLSRAPEARSDHRPMLSDLRESGSLEQDADVVLFTYRQELYDQRQTTDFPGVDANAEIIVGKQRNGQLGTARVAYLDKITRFEEVSS